MFGLDFHRIFIGFPSGLFDTELEVSVIRLTLRSTSSHRLNDVHRDFGLRSILIFLISLYTKCSSKISKLKNRSDKIWVSIAGFDQKTIWLPKRGEKLIGNQLKIESHKEVERKN